MIVAESAFKTITPDGNFVIWMMGWGGRNLKKTSWAISNPNPILLSKAEIQKL